MANKKEIENLAGLIKKLFVEKFGMFRTEDFIEVARELGINISDVHESEAGNEYIYNNERQPGEGFWALAPGAGDASEGMVWVYKKKS